MSPFLELLNRILVSLSGFPTPHSRSWGGEADSSFDFDGSCDLMKVTKRKWWPKERSDRKAKGTRSGAVQNE